MLFAVSKDGSALGNTSDSLKSDYEVINESRFNVSFYFRCIT